MTTAETLITAESLVSEFTREAATTRRVLERVPGDKLSWKPHPKSMSLGQLALHVANMPGGVAEFISEPIAEAPTVPLREAASVQEILAALEWSTATVTDKLRMWGDDGLAADFSMTVQGTTALQLPRLEMVRSVIFNHWYHHRGQLTVYLRLLDVPLPPVFGPTADENPFA